jgi:hypothetical protein
MASLLQKSFPFILLLFGSLVLLVSLLTANRASTGDTTRLLARKIYFSGTMLPDNIFYPLMMMSDRIKLQFSGFEEGILLRVEYADRRYGYAVQLLEKRQTVLSLTTLTKSQKYLFTAGNQVLAQPQSVSPQTRLLVTEVFVLSQQQLAEYKRNYPSSDTKTLDELITETDIIYKKLSDLQEPQQ